MPVERASSNVLIGTTIDGKYQVTREIGRGGMAAVYEAVNADIGKHVAVKVLNPEFVHSTVVVERFLREARAAAAVRSPYICDVYDAGRLNDERPYLVLELLHGESLYERMVKAFRFDPPFVARIFSQVARGLTKAHEANIIHRDLKPENIFLTKGDDDLPVAKILDFGLAKFYETFDGNEAQKRLTREGAVFGTPAYMSPEQVQGQGRVDHRADLWAMACIVYECLVGKTVWSTEQGVAMIFAQIATASIPVPSQQRRDLPAAFDWWFARAMERDPNKRFQTSKELADTLTTALEQGHPSLHLMHGLSEIEAAFGTSGAASPVTTIPSQPGFGALALPKSPSTPQDAQSPSEESAPDTVPMHGGRQRSLNSNGAGPLLEGHEKVATVAASSDDVALSRSTRPKLSGRIGLGAVLVVSGMALGLYLAWTHLLHPAMLPSAWSVSTADATPGAANPALALVATGSMAALAEQTADASDEADATDLLVKSRNTGNEPAWVQTLAEAQDLLANGDVEQAHKAFQRAASSTTSTVPRALLDTLRASLSTEDICRLTALGHPRPFDLSTSVRPPDVAASAAGTVVAWADEYELKHAWKAYTQVLDSSLRARGIPVDVTPEAACVQDMRLFTAANGIVLLYTDPRSQSPGVYMRDLTTQGRIIGPPVQVTPLRRSSVAASGAPLPDGGVVVAFTDERERQDAMKLYVRHFPDDKHPASPPKLIASYGGKTGRGTATIHDPAIAVVNRSLFVTYKLERAAHQSLVLQHIQLDAPQYATGLDDKSLSPAVRHLGEVSTLVDKRRRIQPHSFACDASACYVGWIDSGKGVNAAFINPENGKTIWKKRFALKGSHVALSVNGEGVGLISWFETRRLLVAPVLREGIGQESVVGRLRGEHAPPSVSYGARPGLWSLAWTDYEAGHLEVFAATVSCK